MPAWFKRKAASNPEQVATAQEAVTSADAARERGDSAEALRLYLQAHAASPDHVYTLYWLSTLMQEAGRLEEAFRFGERGLELDPQQVGLLARMASIAHDRLDPLAALELYQRVAALAPDFPEIDARLADQLCLVGRVDEGIAAFERAIARSPEPAKIEQSRLFCLNFSNRVTPQALADAHRAWGAKYCRPSPRTGASFAGKPADAPLHIAYVSADLRNHAVAYFRRLFWRTMTAHASRSPCSTRRPPPRIHGRRRCACMSANGSGAAYVLEERRRNQIVYSPLLCQGHTTTPRPDMLSSII